MSLRGKIVVLFLGLAIVPILIVAGYGYWQASKLAREVVMVALDASATEMANALHQAMNGVDRRMQDLADGGRLAELVADSTFRLSWEDEIAASLSPLAYVVVRWPGAAAETS